MTWIPFIIKEAKRATGELKLQLHEHFGINSKGHLTLDGLDLVRLADSYGTPLFVISEQRLRKKYRQLYMAFKSRYEKVLVAYSVKANFIPAVVRIFCQEGAGADVFPGGELSIALSVGIPREKLLLEGNNKSESEIESGLKAELGFIVADSPSELQKINRISTQLRKKPKVMIRVNPVIDVPTQPNIATGVRDSKFGVSIPSELAFKAYEVALKLENIEVVGIHVHIGSGILTIEPFLKSAEKILDFAGILRDKLNFTLKYLDFGGGFGIPYKPDDPALEADMISEKIFGYLKPRLKEFNEPTVIFEPGRYLVGDSEVLLGRIGNIKESPIGKFASIDASTNLISIFIENRYYAIIIANKADKKTDKTAHISGPLCFSGDVIRRNCAVPEISEGDVVAILNVGAYCEVASSTFNAIPRPPTLLIGKHGVDMIQRRETFEDIIKRDIMPERLGKACAD